MRTILVTGSTDGIGRQTAANLAGNSENHVIIHGRSQEKCNQAISWIKEQLKNPESSAKLSSVVGDFGEMAQVQKIAAEVREKFPELNVLLCNAGVLLPKRQTSKDGLELAFQVNHLAHFALTNTLLPLLKANQPSRIILVSSICHDWYPMDWDDLQAENNYEKYTQYSRTKLMNHLMTFALARRLAGSGVTCNVVEPGVVETKLLRAGGFSGSPVNQSGTCSAFLAQDKGLDGVNGEYYSVGCKKIGSGAVALIEKDQEKLWKISEEMCKKFGILFG